MNHLFRIRTACLPHSRLSFSVFWYRKIRPPSRRKNYRLKYLRPRAFDRGLFSLLARNTFSLRLYALYLPVLCCLSLDCFRLFRFFSSRRKTVGFRKTFLKSHMACDFIVYNIGKNLQRFCFSWKKQSSTPGRPYQIRRPTKSRKNFIAIFVFRKNFRNAPSDTCRKKSESLTTACRFGNGWSSVRLPTWKACSVNRPPNRGRENIEGTDHHDNDRKQAICSPSFGLRGTCLLFCAVRKN